MVRGSLVYKSNDLTKRGEISRADGGHMKVRTQSMYHGNSLSLSHQKLGNKLCNEGVIMVGSIRVDRGSELVMTEDSRIKKQQSMEKLNVPT